VKYISPGQPGSIVPVAPRYENFVDGKWGGAGQGRAHGAHNRDERQAARDLLGGRAEPASDKDPQIIRVPLLAGGDLPASSSPS